MPLIESFTVDHRIMNAPQVRKAKVMNLPKGDIVEVYDLRFVKPNTTPMETAAVHTLEHLIATYMREKMKNIIDVSPMGCRTGFYMSVYNENKKEDIQEVLIYALKKILETTEIPGATEKECGNYKDHSLVKAKEVAKRVIEGFENGNKS